MQYGRDGSAAPWTRAASSGPRATARPPHRRVASWRRWGVALLLLTVSGGALVWESSHRSLPLHQETAVRDPYGALVEVPPGRTEADWHPLSLDPDLVPLEFGLLAAQEAGVQAWLHRGWLPDPDHPHAGMVERALRDLHTLTGPAGTAPGAVLAGPSPAWRYVWPRDASFAAAAYARSGHLDDAVAALTLLQELQAEDGSMQARYRPDGSGEVPDDREPQEDGPGWALWAVREVARLRPEVVPDLGPLVVRSTDRLLERLDPATGLPRPSPDYWERPEEELTLGVAATSLMGLEAAAWLAGQDSVPELAWRLGGVDPDVLGPTAAEVRRRLVEVFGPRYPRRVGAGADAAVSFLLPPYVQVPVEGAEAARQQGQRSQLRRAGGLAPGADWRPDGVSWTPETALQALAAAEAGRSAEAAHWLGWLDDHRTRAGSLPEKVIHNGRPAATAPLAWTAALVVLSTAPGP